MISTPAVPQNAGRGQPTKLSPIKHQIIVDAVSVGMSWRGAAQYAGVAPSTLIKWRQWGEEAWGMVVDALDALDVDEYERIDALDDDRDPDHPEVPTARDVALEQFVDERHRPYLRLFRALDRAVAYFELRNLTLVQEAAAGYAEEETTTVTKRDDHGDVVETVTTTKRRRARHWAAAMTLLERRIPERYAQLSRTEHTGLGGGPIEVDHGPIEVLHNMSGADRDARTAEILRIMADADIIDVEVVDELLVQPSGNGDSAGRAALGSGHPATDEVRPDHPDA